MDLGVVGPVEVYDRPDQWFRRLPDFLSCATSEPPLRSGASVGIVVITGFFRVEGVAGDGHAVNTGNANHLFDSLAEVFTIFLSEAVVPRSVQRRLIGTGLDAERVA
ncbi:hypothetical protein [Halococcus salifodinae]|uniref:hypothetical protein n=1 Tax=Halococcus salifodinae TaxID=36738 RepID=UPI003F864A3C